MKEALRAATDHLDEHDPGGVVGFHLYGSAVSSGLRPDSDIDTLLLTRRSFTETERASLTDLLLSISGWHGHSEQLPEASARRPIELTSLVVGTEPPWTPLSRRDFQYGEWLRADLVAGSLPGPAEDPDVMSVIATAHAAHRTLRGRPLHEVVSPVAPEDLRRAMLASIPRILDDLVGDERNVLLTLARMVVTAGTGRIVSKDEAAREVASTLSTSEQGLLLRARSEYLGQESSDWFDRVSDVQALSRILADRVDSVRPG